VVEGRCEESAGVCKESVVEHSGGEEVEAVGGSGGTEGDEAQDSIPVGATEGGIGTSFGRRLGRVFVVAGRNHFI
jgi:hypothetical protein